jgi:predicted RNA-binding protein with PIN domain
MIQESILVDGYSVIFRWPELQKARLKNLATSRDLLIQILTQYQDCVRKKIIVVFDGRSPSKGTASIRTNLQIYYSQQGQTADAVIERIVGQSAQPHLFLVATDDQAEQNIVEGLGGKTVSCDIFRSMIQEELEDLQELMDVLARNRGSGNHIKK